MKRPFALLLAATAWTPSASAQLPEVGTEGGPLRALEAQEAEDWLAGREIFEREWTAEEGLGSPMFNAVSCAFCHKDPATGGAGNNEFNVIQTDGFSHYGGDRSPQPVRSEDDDAVELNRLTVLRARRKQFEDRAANSRRFVPEFTEIQTPSLLGLGLIDTIPDEEILRRADPDDEDNDGIRGVVRLIDVGGNSEVGRFGWKADTPRLDDFVCMALGGEIGLTTPDQGRGFGSQSDRDGTADPELDDRGFEQLTFFVRQLAPPVPSSAWKDYQAQVGERLFTNLGCAQCHVPELQGANGPVRLYSDLLIHQLFDPEVVDHPGMDGLVRGARKNGTIPAVPSGIRTPPLWGVAKTAPYWHDGSAADLNAAVLAHDGEAAAAREAYATLEEIDQQALVVFLKHL